MTGRALVVRGDALQLPLPDESVDLCVTSPPYWALRDYQTPGQLGSEPTPQEFLTNLWTATAEMVRVLKPTGSIFVDLGDKYSAATGADPNAARGGRNVQPSANPASIGIPEKSLMLLPERYRIGCVDQLGLIARAVIVWQKPNGLPESVRDRVRRSHEDWVHLVKQPRYYSAVDEVREPHNDHAGPPSRFGNITKPGEGRTDGIARPQTFKPAVREYNPLGKLPGSVWTIPSEPLRLPAWLGVDHYACVDTATEVLTRRGWLRHDQLQVGDEVAGYDLAGQVGRWTTCEAVHRYQHNGPMVAIEKRDLSMRLTPNHRAVVWTRDREGRPTIGPATVEAGELAARHFIPRAAAWEAEDAYVLGEELAALLGWVAAEGWYLADGTVALSQSYVANPANVETLRKLLEHLDGIEREDIRTREWRGRPAGDVRWFLKPRLSATIRELMPDKRLTEWLANLPRNEAQVLLDGFIAGDGHIRPDGRISIFQKDRENLDWLQLIAVTLGYRTRITEEAERFILYLNRDIRPLTLRGTNGSNDPIPTVHHAGVVWCPSTGTGTFFARRNGIVFVTGNSFPSEWPRRFILGWSPPGICCECGMGRWPVVDQGRLDESRPQARRAQQLAGEAGLTEAHLEALVAQGTSDVGRAAATQTGTGRNRAEVQRLAAEAKAVLGGYSREFLLARPSTILGYACACTPHTDHPGTGHIYDGQEQPYSTILAAGSYPPRFGSDPANNLSARPKVGPWREYHLDGWTASPTRPALVLDPFSGVGTTIGVARQLGRIGIGIDLSHPYCRAAKWRVFDSGQFGKALARTNLERQGTLT